MLEGYWLEFLRIWGGYSLFPREYSLKRKTVSGKEFFDLLYTYYNTTSCYTSVFSEYQIENNLYDTIFIEAEDVDSLTDAILIHNELIKVFNRFDLKFREYYSGNRGWHFYLDFPLTRIDDYNSSIKSFVYDYLDVGDLVDRHVIGNKRGVARIPYTLNHKSKRYSMVLLNPIDRYDVIERSKKIHFERPYYTSGLLNENLPFLSEHI